MRRSTRDTKSDASLDDEWVQHILRRVAVAAVLIDPKLAETLLTIPAAALGQLIKNQLCEVVGVATVYGIDLTALRDAGENLRERIKHALKQTPEREQLLYPYETNAERYPLVLQGKLLRAKDFCKAAGITEKKLDKRVASRRMFGVLFGTEYYYPAFFLSPLIYRDDFAKVVRCLGKIDTWTMFDFFTTPVESLGGSTPLQLLKAKDVEPVAEEAATFGKWHTHVHP